MHLLLLFIQLGKTKIIIIKIEQTIEYSIDFKIIVLLNI